ncbi:MAG: helix-turn-helix transcriptional regulator [Acinetobacter sp.]
MILLTKERKDRGLSMSALARAAEMHVSSISQIEGGHLKPYPGQVEKLATAIEWNGAPIDLFREIGE